MEGLQESVVRKFKRAEKDKEPIVYEFTDDPALLHQYYRLRDLMYRKVHNLKEFEGGEDVYDKISHILIARRGRLCVGGCRLTIREPDENFLLPMETEEYKLRDVYPSLDLDMYRHAEASRFAIMEGFSEREVMYSLSKIICDKCFLEGMQYCFAKSPYTLARNWRLIGNKVLGVKTSILPDDHIPANPLYPEIKWYITVFQSDTAPLQDMTDLEFVKKPEEETVH